MKDILETFDNPQKKNDYLIKMDIPEFTCICPLTSQPDFANSTLNMSQISYVWSSNH